MQYPFLAHTSNDFFLTTLTRPLPLPLPLLPVEGLLVLKLRTCAVLLEISFVDFSFASKPRCRGGSSSNFTGFWALFLCLRSLSGFKLGNLSDLEEGSVQQSRNLGFSAMESPSSKRARAPNNSAQVPSCLVDGCNSDLSKCRDYHRRHKVCELHSKTSRVTIRGQEQRFCQQCSRFHSLGEFDDGKRSCRKRLDGHNKRRRKPQPDPSLSSSHFLTNYQGTKLVPFSSPQMFPASALASCPLVGAPRSKNDSVLYCSSSHQQLNLGDRQMLFSASSPHSYKPQIQFPFMQGNKDLSIGSSSVCGTSLDPNPLSGSSDGCSSQKTIPSSLVGPLSSPGCALSLLSSSLPAAAAAAQASHQRDADATMQFYRPEPSHSSMSTLHYNQVRAVSESEGSFLAAPGSLHGMFRGGHSGSSASGSQSHHSPSFTWECWRNNISS